MRRRPELTRRELLGGAGAAATLGACGPGARERTGIRTVVLVMMENRSFDHYLGALTLEEGRADVDGLTAEMSNPLADGTAVPPFRSDAWCLADPPHGWGSSRVQHGEGRNDGFVQAYWERWGDRADPRLPMGYHARADLPVTYALSDAYTTCERWFSSLLTSTWPNRLYAHGAQSEGQPGNSSPDGGFFTMRTIWDQLDEAAIPWAYYYSDLPFIALFGRFAGRDEIRPVEDFFDDCRDGTLPRVCMVEPAFSFNDDHPPHHPMLGQLFLSTVHNALALSPQWRESLLVTTYDEHGGFFDHVPPPLAADERAAQGFDQLGFRVPAIIAGPFVRAGHVSPVVFDHTSPLAHIQRMHGLDPLTARDAAANDLASLLDPLRVLADAPAEPAVLPVIELTEAEVLAQCEDDDRRGRSGQDDLEEALRRLEIPPHLDRLDRMGDVVRRLLETSERVGAARIR